MRDRIAAWWRGRDMFDVLAAVFIAVCIVLILVNLSMYPVYIDIPYHMAVTRGFQEAGGVTTWDFWDYAPAGRPHIYPPLLHVGMSLLQDLGLSAQAVATLVCAIMFPLILLSLWWSMRRLFGSRAAFYALVLVGVPYAFFYQSGITVAASLVLALTPLVFLALEEDRKVAAAVLLAMCLYSHLVLGHLVALALLIYLLHRRDAWKKILSVLAAAYVLYLPWGIVVVSNLGSFTASEPGLGSDFSLHLLLWGLAVAGFVTCYFRRKRYYLLPAYLLSMVPIAFFYSHRFWEGHIFLPLAMLGGVALDGLHAFLAERLSRRPGTASYAGKAAGIVLAALLLLVFFADPVLASTPKMPAAVDVRDAAGPPGRSPAQPYGGPRTGLSGGTRRGLPGRPLQRLQEPASGSLRLSLHPTTVPVLLGWEEATRSQLGTQEAFGEENEDMMAAVMGCSEPGDVVFVPEGRLGDLVYAMTGRYATQGMFHEVQPDGQTDPLRDADLAVIPLNMGAAAGDAATARLSGVLEAEGWSEAARTGRYVIMVHEDSPGGGDGAAAAALPMWAAYALLLAAVFAVVADCLRRRRGPGMPGGPVPTRPPPGPHGGGVGSRMIAVVPAHNEEENVAGVVLEIRRARPDLDVLVVDDGSSDATGKRALLAGAVVLRLDANLGVGEAERRALAYAYERGYDCAVRLDGDGQHPAACIGSLVAPLRRGEAEVVVGSRFLADAQNGRAISRPRRAGIAYFRFVLRLSTSLRFSDPTSGCRAYSRRAMYMLSRAEPRRYPEVTSLRRLAMAGIKVTEVPVEMRPRRHGKSSIGPREALTMIAGVTVDLLRDPVPAGYAGRFPHRPSRPDAPRKILGLQV